MARDTSTNESDEEKAARLKQEGREAANRLQAAADAQVKPFAWFENLYAEAGDDRDRIPWANAAPRFKLAEWLEKNAALVETTDPETGFAPRALDVGCGLGDNAVLIADAGWKVTAFDLSQTAVSWARKTHKRDNLTFITGDLLKPPAAWHGTFDLVHETYNLQAMPRDTVTDALASLALCVKPGGRLLIMTRFRDHDEVPEGPPWPLSREELAPLLDLPDMTVVHNEEFGDQRTQPIRHLLIDLEKAGDET